MQSFRQNYNTYNDIQWCDRLTAFEGKAFVYDNIGNPTTYYNGGTDAYKYTFTWQNGRELASAVKGGVTTTYKYGADGLRIQKSVGTVVYDYYYSNGMLVRQTWGSNYIDFLYDESGVPYSFVYNGTQYYYLKNLQGDVTGIVNRNKELLVEYNYDAWGNILSITDTYVKLNYWTGLIKNCINKWYWCWNKVVY